LEEKREITEIGRAFFPGIKRKIGGRNVAVKSGTEANQSWEGLHIIKEKETLRSGAVPWREGGTPFRGRLWNSA